MSRGRPTSGIIEMSLEEAAMCSIEDASAFDVIKIYFET
jgi:hypothetical protein